MSRVSSKRASPRTVVEWLAIAPFVNRSGTWVSRMALRFGGEVTLIEFRGDSKFVADFNSPEAAELAVSSNAIPWRQVRTRASRPAQSGSSVPSVSLCASGAP